MKQNERKEFCFQVVDFSVRRTVMDIGKVDGSTENIPTKKLTCCVFFRLLSALSVYQEQNHEDDDDKNDEHGHHSRHCSRSRIH
jgi:hypothetical protein